LQLDHLATCEQALQQLDRVSAQLNAEHREQVSAGYYREATRGVATTAVASAPARDLPLIGMGHGCGALLQVPL
ncbi:hypothetical protein B484DRAFT_399397, partial [Ochromonadaceae sp. CCMP2298]